MDKYVSFIDILGFKVKLANLSQTEAENFISQFSSMLYREWDESECKTNPKIKGFIVSDSIIIHTTDTKKASLETLLNLLVNIFQKSFSEMRILLRGAISKGEFSQLRTYSFDNLQKGLIVGQAYIDAYTLESKYKGSVILFNKNVKDDILNYFNARYAVSNIDITNELFTLHWANFDFISEESNLRKYTRMACESKWLPHYYHTLFYLLDGKDELIIRETLQTIIQFIKFYDIENRRSNLTIFINNAYSQEVNKEFQSMMTKYVIDNYILNGLNG